MNVKQIPVVTDSAGDFVTDVKVTGEVIAVGLKLVTATALDLTLTDLDTGESVFTKSTINAGNTWEPRRLATSAAGVDLAAAAGPPAIDNVYIPQTVFKTLHVVVANGGNAKTALVLVAYRG